MRRIAIATALVAALAAVPAQAKHGHGPKAHKHEAKGKSKRCKTHRAGWVVKGTLDSQTLAASDDGRYSGDVTLDVVRTNKHARSETGTQTYTVDGVRVAFEGSDRNGDGNVDAADVAAGDRVVVIGKVTRVHRKCDQSAAGVVSIRKVVFADAEPVESDDSDDGSDD